MKAVITWEQEGWIVRIIGDEGQTIDVYAVSSLCINSEGYWVKDIENIKRRWRDDEGRVDCRTCRGL